VVTENSSYNLKPNPKEEDSLFSMVSHNAGTPLPKKGVIEGSLKSILAGKAGSRRTLKLPSQVSLAKESVDRVRNSSGSVFEGLEDQSFELDSMQARDEHSRFQSVEELIKRKDKIEVPVSNKIKNPFDKSPHCAKPNRTNCPLGKFIKQWDKKSPVIGTIVMENRADRDKTEATKFGQTDLQRK
jgi:hypothetical protein